MAMEIKSPDGIGECCRHNELLAWATARIEQLTDGACARQQVCDMLDWMAYFTREHFGFQERLLAECSKQREYLSNRAAVHSEFRRQLAQLCLDSIRGDATVPARLRELCHQMLRDAHAQQEAIADLVRNSGTNTRLRANPRRGRLAVEAAQQFESRLPQAAH